MRKLDGKIDPTIDKNVFEAGRCTCIPTRNLKMCLVAFMLNIVSIVLIWLTSLGMCGFRGMEVSM